MLQLLRQIKEELRKKYNQINKTPESGGADFLKKFLMMEEGTTQVRVLPDKNPQCSKV